MRNVSNVKEVSMLPMPGILVSQSVSEFVWNDCEMNLGNFVNFMYF